MKLLIMVKTLLKARTPSEEKPKINPKDKILTFQVILLKP